LAASLAVLAIFWAGLLERAAHAAPVAWYQPAGAAAMLAGIALRRVAIRQLGEHFVSSVSVPGGRPLVQHGIYTRLRHPSESGLLLLALGTALLLGSGAAAVLAACVLLPLILVRMRIEDGCLLAAFGDEFQSYRTRVPALFPWFPGGMTATGRSTRTIAPPRLMPYNDTIGRGASSGTGAVHEPPGAAP
jgi:protein-S-isoprenylcysteine O-methyltransferase Ste14